MRLAYRHLDVFSAQPFSGNGLAVFGAPEFPPAATMLALTREMRQFEAVFLKRGPLAEEAEARIFTTTEELPFAGHPLLGAAAVLHDEADAAAADLAVRLMVGERPVALTSRRTAAGFRVEMDQGAATHGPPLDWDAVAPVAAVLGLKEGDMLDSPAPAVVSTGLAYLLLPLRREALARARIGGPDLEPRLARLGAKFVYLFDPKAREGRTGENDGSLEDAATGSAAGPVAAWLIRAGLARAGEKLTLSQGGGLGRPSALHAWMDAQGGLHVAGDVVMVARGEVEAPQATAS